MLVAHLQQQRVEASRDLVRGADYRCPGCGVGVVLKKGEIKIAHFAHRVADGDCTFSQGETVGHMEAKRLFGEALRRRGLKAEYEYIIGDQRADVAGWAPDGKLFAVEVQHTSLPEAELARRIAGYVEKGVPQLWVPFIRKEYAGQQVAERTRLPSAISRYSIRPFERYLATAYGGQMWFYDEVAKKLLMGRFGDYWLVHDGGDFGAYYTYSSSRWRKLELSRFYCLDDLFFSLDNSRLGIDLGGCVEIEQIMAVGRAVQAFEGAGWSLADLQRRDEGLFAALREQRDLFAEALAAGDEGQIEIHGQATCRGWQQAARRLLGIEKARIAAAREALLRDERAWPDGADMAIARVRELWPGATVTSVREKNRD